MVENPPPSGALMTQESANDPEVTVIPGAGGARKESDEPAENISHPAKVMRIGTMVRQLLEEVRSAPLDDKSRARMREIYETSVAELSEVLSPELKEELTGLSRPFAEDEVPSDAQLRVAHAQLVGWLEGLFQGIQAALFAQQVQSRAQFEEMRRRGLPSGEHDQQRPGQYL
jgi:proteasome activator-like protein